MSKLLQWNDWFERIRNREGEQLQVDEHAISTAFARMKERESSTIVKIVSIIGGILGTQFFSGFLLVSGIAESGIALLFTGWLFWAGAMFFIRRTNLLVLDTMVVTIYLLAYILISYGLNLLKWHENSIALIVIFLSLIAIFFIRHSVLAFFTFAMMFASGIFLFFNNHLGSWAQLWPAVLACLILLLYWKEASYISFHPRVNYWYKPLLIVLVLLFIGFLQLLGKRHWVDGLGDYFSFTSLWLMVLLGWVVYQILPYFGINRPLQKLGIVLILLIILLPTHRSPAIAGILLLLLLSFRSGDRWVWMLSLLAMAVFMFEFYYDLDYTLLTKSYILMGTGFGMLLFYYFTRKFWQPNEME
jgi:hypothetical protein